MRLNSGSPVMPRIFVIAMAPSSVSGRRNGRYRFARHSLARAGWPDEQRAVHLRGTMQSLKIVTLEQTQAKEPRSCVLRHVCLVPAMEPL